MLKTLCLALSLAAVASPALADTPLTLTVPLTITGAPANFASAAVDCRLSTATVAQIKSMGSPAAFTAAVANGGLTTGNPLGAALYGVDLGIKSVALRNGVSTSPNVSFTSTLPAYGTENNPFAYASAICMLEGFKKSEGSTEIFAPGAETKPSKTTTYKALPAY